MMMIMILEGADNLNAVRTTFFASLIFVKSLNHHYKFYDDEDDEMMIVTQCYLPLYNMLGNCTNSNSNSGVGKNQRN